MFSFFSFFPVFFFVFFFIFLFFPFFFFSRFPPFFFSLFLFFPPACKFVVFFPFYLSPFFISLSVLSFSLLSFLQFSFFFLIFFFLSHDQLRLIFFLLCSAHQEDKGWRSGCSSFSFYCVQREHKSGLRKKRKKKELERSAFIYLRGDQMQFSSFFPLILINRIRGYTDTPRKRNV